MLQIFGSIDKPDALNKFSNAESAFGQLISLFIKGLIVIAGVYALINIILAGYAFMSAGDDPQKVAGAWSKIFQTIIGLAVAAGAFVLAAIFGQILFGDPMLILQPEIPTL